ncbi:hypothetical protein MD484_g1003, partial [Candolleomyces efflorescens]
MATYDLAGSPCPWGSLTKFAISFDSVLEDAVVLGPESIALPPRITSLGLRLPNARNIKIETHSPPLLLQPSILERLTTLSLKWLRDEFDGTMLLNALSHCADLDALDLSFGNCAWSCTDDPKALMLPKLRELRLKECKDALKFLKFIDAPHLACLNLHIGAVTPPDDLSSFISKQFARSQGALNVTLRVFYAMFESEWDIPDFLQHVPHVARLILDYCVSLPEDDDADFFESLKCYSLSDLKALEIFGLPREFPIEWVEDYILSRRAERAHDGLKTVIVKYDPDEVPESGTVKLLKLVERMRNTGVSFCVE